MIEIAEKPKTKRNHQGRTIRLLRTQKGKTQEQVGKDNNMAQSRVFELELMEELPEDVLTQFAEYFGVSEEFIKTFDLDEVARNFISTYNNTATLTDNSNMNAPLQQADNLNINNPDLPILLKEAYEKIAELSKQVGVLETELSFYKQK